MENLTLPEENEIVAQESDSAVEEENPYDDTEAAEAESTEVSEGEGGDAPDYAALAERDLTALCEAFPELSGMSSLAELPEPERYGELREAGLSPIEAFCAAHHKILTARRADNRAHLSPSVGRSANAAGGRISAAALSDARDLFPTLSDREIEALYRRVASTR